MLLLLTQNRFVQRDNIFCGYYCIQIGSSLIQEGVSGLSTWVETTTIESTGETCLVPAGHPMKVTDGCQDDLSIDQSSIESFDKAMIWVATKAIAREWMLYSTWNNTRYVVGTVIDWFPSDLLCSYQNGLRR